MVCMLVCTRIIFSSGRRGVGWVGGRACRNGMETEVEKGEVIAEKGIERKRIDAYERKEQQNRLFREQEQKFHSG